MVNGQRLLLFATQAKMTKKFTKGVPFLGSIIAAVLYFSCAATLDKDNILFWVFFFPPGIFSSYVFPVVIFPFFALLDDFISVPAIVAPVVLVHLLLILGSPSLYYFLVSFRVFLLPPGSSFDHLLAIVAMVVLNANLAPCVKTVFSATVLMKIFRRGRLKLFTPVALFERLKCHNGYIIAQLEHLCKSYQPKNIQLALFAEAA